MTAGRIGFIVGVLLGTAACQTAALKARSEPKPIEDEAPEPEPPPLPPPPPPIEPTEHLRTTPELVTPGPEESLMRRSPKARCPSIVELDSIEKTVSVLGKDTLELVKEDLANLRQTLTRRDADAIASCCNQMEQLAQDAEVMNEDKDSAVDVLHQIRSTTLQLCPPE